MDNREDQTDRVLVIQDPMSEVDPSDVAVEIRGQPSSDRVRERNQGTYDVE